MKGWSRKNEFITMTSILSENVDNKEQEHIMQVWAKNNTIENK